MCPGGGGCLRKSGSPGPAEAISRWPAASGNLCVCLGDAVGGSGMAQWVGRALTGCSQPHPPSSQLGRREVPIKSPAFLLEWQACDLSPRGQLAGESEYFQQRIQAESQGRPGSRSPTGRQPLGRFKGFLFSRTDSTHFPPPVFAWTALPPISAW